MSWEAGKGVVEAGRNIVRIYASTINKITADDLIGELTDISGFGSQKEGKERGGYHYAKKQKFTGQATPNDISFTENLTYEALTLRRGQYNNGTKFYNVVVDTANNNAILYKCHGEISQWGMEIKDGDTCTLTYTMVLDDDDPEITLNLGE